MEPSSHITGQIPIFSSVIFTEVSFLIFLLILIVLLTGVAIMLIYPLNTTMINLFRTLIRLKLK